MQVETFEETEVAELIGCDADAESLALIERLGLTGQQNLIGKSGETDQQVRCPYRLITTEENFVYRTLCPKVTEASKYGDSPIPLRILQIIAWAQDNPFFKKLEIWSAKSATVKDPVLIGIASVPGQTWGERTFILGRWGSELMPLEILIPDAIKRWKEARLAKLQEIRSKVAQGIVMLDGWQVIPDTSLQNEPYASHIAD
jgi:hypothetical protein